MPLNSHTLPTNSCQDFCLALKAARERKGITLDEIAETTKIPAYLFAELERSDLHRWPEGFFRRSFFRDYVRLIGVPVTEACAEFGRLFVGDEPPDAAPPAAVPETKPQPMRDALERGLATFGAVWKRGANALSQTVAWADKFKHEDKEEVESCEWISDARRVRSAPPPKIRVRIKMPK